MQQNHHTDYAKHRRIEFISSYRIFSHTAPLNPSSDQAYQKAFSQALSKGTK
jgi:hypothetical protein